jgi:hypothetical protein
MPNKNKKQTGGSGKNTSKPKGSSALANIRSAFNRVMLRNFRSIATTVDERRYRMCLKDPFSTEANGAQVPDMFPFPLATFKARCVQTINTGASGTFGVMVTPHPYLASSTFTGSQSGPLTIYTANNNAAGLVPGALSGRLTNFRVVGFGVRIKNLLQPTAVTGKLIMACVPGQGNRCLTTKLYENEAMDLTVQSTNVGGVGLTSANGSIPSSILELPESCEVSVASMISRNIDLVYRPLTMRAMEFQATTGIGNTTAANAVGIADAPYWDVATGLVGDTAVTAGAHTLIDLAGFPVWYVSGVGLPVSTSNVIELEFIWHLEGVPALNASTTSVDLVADAPEAKYGWDSLGRILRDAFNDDMIRSSVVMGAQTAVSTMFPIFGNMYQGGRNLLMNG